MLVLACSWSVLKEGVGKLVPKEKLLLCALPLFFLSYVFSSIVNGWDEGSWRILGKELRFLGFIPLYFYAKRFPEVFRALGAGALVSIPLSLAVVGTELWGYGLDRAQVGVYGSLFTGPVTVLSLIVASYFVRSLDKEASKMILPWILLATFIVATLMSRAAFLGFLVWVFIYFVIILTRIRDWALLTLCALVLVLTAERYLDHAYVPSISRALTELEAYVSASILSKTSELRLESSSIGIRLEMLRAAVLVWSDKPLLGVGGYNFQYAVQPFIQEGRLNAILAGVNHPHNVFAEILVSKGVLGLSCFLLFVYSVFALCLTKLDGERGINIGIYAFSILLVLLVMMQTESAIVLKGNFIAIFLVFVGVSLGAHLSDIKKVRDAPHGLRIRN